MDNKKFRKLLDSYFDEMLEGSTKAEFEQMLLDSPAAQKMFWEQAKLHAALRQIGQEGWRTKLPAGLQEPQPSGSWHSFLQGWQATVLVTLAACLAFLLLAYSLGDQKLERDSLAKEGAVTSEKTNSDNVPSSNLSNSLRGNENPENNLEAEKENKLVGVLRRQIDVDWESPLEAISNGGMFPPRRIKFNSGMVELQTDRGVVITLEGESDLEILSGMEVVCHKGNLLVEVPPAAIGFVVKTRQFDVVDLGTSFALKVDEDDESEVHVIKGLVEVFPGQKGEDAKRELREGQSVGIVDGVLKDIAVERGTFLTPAKLRELADSADHRRMLAWTRKQTLLAKDPHCLVYFDFQDEPETGYLTNKAIGSGVDTGGTVVGAQWTRGRWPGKNALEFRRNFDRVLFSLPSTFQSLTCLTSVRIDALDSQSTVLLTAPDLAEGSFRWELSPSEQQLGDTAFCLSSAINGKWNKIGNSSASPLFPQKRLGTWVQIAFVLDGENQVLDQYIDGKLWSRQQLSKELLLLGGNDASAEKSSLLKQQFTAMLGQFVGRIDEFAVFDRALDFQNVRIKQLGGRVSWNHAAKDSQWDNPDNWYGRLPPGIADVVFVDHHGEDAAYFSADSKADLIAVRVGGSDGQIGEMTIAGGELNAFLDSDFPSRAGVGGGDGKILQQDGTVTLNSLQVGTDDGSKGLYQLLGGQLRLCRGILRQPISLSIGRAGQGRFEIAGGEFETRGGVTLGREGGVGTFAVKGSAIKRIAIGSHLNHDGFWFQETGSRLEVAIDDAGVTPIFIDKVEASSSNAKHKFEPLKDGNVSFSSGSILSVGFDGDPQTGSWDIMNWEGELNDQGLVFAPGVDQQRWSFEFVDTDESGTPDTLRVIAR